MFPFTPWQISPRSHHAASHNDTWHITTDEIPKVIMDASPTFTLRKRHSRQISVHFVCKIPDVSAPGQQCWTVDCWKEKHPDGACYSECVSIHCGILLGYIYNATANVKSKQQHVPGSCDPHTRDWAIDSFNNHLYHTFSFIPVNTLPNLWQIFLFSVGFDGHWWLESSIGTLACLG
jgi:hypothetical protein